MEEEEEDESEESLRRARDFDEYKDGAYVHTRHNCLGSIIMVIYISQSIGEAVETGRTWDSHTHLVDLYTLL